MATKKELRTVEDETVQATVRSLAEVRAKKEALTELEGAIVSRLIDLLGGESAKVGDLEAVVKAGSRSLDGAALEKAFPPEKNPELYSTETKLDVKKVREQKSPAELAAFLKEPGKPSVTLK